MEKEITNKEFVQQNIPFKELKKAGFFDKSVKFNDYDAIANRVLTFYCTTKRKYMLREPAFDLQLHPGFITGHMPSTVDKNGDLNVNGFKLSL